MNIKRIVQAKPSLIRYKNINGTKVQELQVAILYGSLMTLSLFKST